MATLITTKPSMMSFPSSLNRMGTFPIDLSSVWYSYEDAVAYATQTNFKPTYEGQTGLPYVGQILTVVETAEDGTTSVTAYSIQNEKGDLAQVGTVTLGDEISITRDAETGELSLVGFGDAEAGDFATIGEDGKLTWKKIAVDEATIDTNADGEMALYGVEDLTWKDGETDVTTYQPKLVKDTNGIHLTWEIPSATTVEGLDSRLKTVEGNLTTAEGAIQDNAEAIEAVEKDLADNYYDKDEVDAKLTSVFKFQGVKTYKDELPTTGQVVGDVWLVIYDGNTPAEGETNTLPVANIEYVWTSENKWEPLGDDIIDLTNYYTKSEVDGLIDDVEATIGDIEDELAKKGAIEKVEDGTEAWGVKVTDAEGNETHAKVKTVNASNEVAGLVKGDGTNVSIADGVITVNEAGHAGSADEADEATHAGSADTAGVADEAKKVQHTFTVAGVSFDGSEDKAVSADDLKTAVEISNYYTKAEAETNFMSETETNSAIAAVTDPIVADVEAIKGLGADDEATLLDGVSLKSLKATTDTHAQHLGELDTQVGTANTNASNAVTTAGEAKTTAEEAAATAGAANTTAEEAKAEAEAATRAANEAKAAAAEAVGTANTANTIAGEAKTAAQGAVETANTAKDTADSANAQATANKTAIEALQAEDTAIKGLVNTNTTNITNLTNTVDAGLADRYTKAETNTYVAEQIAAIDHLKREVVESLPGTPDANTIYMVPRDDKVADKATGTLAYGTSWTAPANLIAAIENQEELTIIVEGTQVLKGVATRATEDTSIYTLGENSMAMWYFEVNTGSGTMALTQNTGPSEDGQTYEIAWSSYPENNIYIEWMYINQKWERLGTNSTDLVNYVTKDGAIDNTTVGGVNTATAITNAAKTAEWEQISNKPNGQLVNQVTITITAGNTSAEWSQFDDNMLLTKTFLNYRAYLAGEEVIIGHSTDGILHTFTIASAQTDDIKIEVQYLSLA